MLYRRGGLLVASASSICYGALLDLQYFGIIHPFYTRTSELMAYSIGYYWYNLLMNIAAFYVVAFLSSYLAEELRRSGVRLKAKQKDLDQLELINRNIVQSVNSGLITLNKELEITYMNPAAERIAGLSHRELKGHHIRDVFPRSIELMRGCRIDWRPLTLAINEEMASNSTWDSPSRCSGILVETNSV